MLSHCLARYNSRQLPEQPVPADLQPDTGNMLAARYYRCFKSKIAMIAKLSVPSLSIFILITNRSVFIIIHQIDFSEVDMEPRKMEKKSNPK